MDKEIGKLQGLHHLILCDYRSQNRLIQSPEFVEVWENASNEQREIITGLIDKADPDKLKEIMSTVLAGSGLDKRSFNALRKMASIKEIKYYSRLTKAELIHALG